MSPSCCREPFSMLCPLLSSSHKMEPLTPPHYGCRSTGAAIPHGPHPDLYLTGGNQRCRVQEAEENMFNLSPHPTILVS